AQLAAGAIELERNVVARGAEAHAAALGADFECPFGALREIAIQLAGCIVPRGQLLPRERVERVVPGALRGRAAAQERLDQPLVKVAREARIAMQIDQLPPAARLEGVGEQVRRARFEKRQKAVEPERGGA